ncbi:DNA-processing protein DprA [Atopobiaceae bacterium 24-176]
MACDFELLPDDPLWPPLVGEESGIERIYGRGDPEVLSSPCISIVGARRGTPYGRAVAALAGRVAAEAGITVVSGGAMGVDAAAARAALAAGGRTVVCAGTGADIVYPASSRDVFEGAQAHGGAVVALEPWGSPPARWTFPKRNRLIAALSPVLVVTEAGVPSGTFSTADAAVELGRTVYAAPGSMFSAPSRGTNLLISQGATMIVDEESLEMSISMDYGVLRRPAVRESKDHGRAFSALVAQPMRPDDLAASVGKGVLEVMRLLSDYEAAGLVTRLPDGRYAPTEAALLGER